MVQYLTRIINSHVDKLINDDMLYCETFLRELIMIRYGFLALSNGHAAVGQRSKGYRCLCMHEPTV
jgi:hypothetical protein